MLTKTEFFKTLITNRVMPMASLRKTYDKERGQVDFYMHQDNAPNAFLSRHRHGTETATKAFIRYAAWMREYAVKFDSYVEEAHEEALEMLARSLEDDVEHSGFADVAYTPNAVRMPDEFGSFLPLIGVPVMRPYWDALGVGTTEQRVKKWLRLITTRNERLLAALKKGDGVDIENRRAELNSYVSAYTDFLTAWDKQYFWIGSEPHRDDVYQCESIAYMYENYFVWSAISADPKQIAALGAPYRDLDMLIRYHHEIALEADQYPDPHQFIDWLGYACRLTRNFQALPLVLMPHIDRSSVPPAAQVENYRNLLNDHKYNLTFNDGRLPHE